MLMGSHLVIEDLLLGVFHLIGVAVAGLRQLRACERPDRCTDTQLRHSLVLRRRTRAVASFAEQRSSSTPAVGQEGSLGDFGLALPVDTANKHALTLSGKPNVVIVGFLPVQVSADSRWREKWRAGS